MNVQWHLSVRISRFRCNLRPFYCEKGFLGWPLAEDSVATQLGIKSTLKVLKRVVRSKCVVRNFNHRCSHWCRKWWDCRILWRIFNRWRMVPHFATIVVAHKAWNLQLYVSLEDLALLRWQQQQLRCDGVCWKKPAKKFDTYNLFNML